jgi:hypothetical protein
MTSLATMVPVTMVRVVVLEQRQGTQDRSMQIWQFVTLELWARMFLDGGSRQIAAEVIAQQSTTACKSS